MENTILQTPTEAQMRQFAYQNGLQFTSIMPNYYRLLENGVQKLVVFLGYNFKKKGMDYKSLEGEYVEQFKNWIS